ncbi:hypothetical protein P0136_09945 [Lentisphaerota bacterium ZTH]|nr:hypothetical protein JYG24_12540 [Lentisphaerota bacterium]WET05685.1 hypothetical protein P0136_09945 [Lentisphaerota bacterium ZTH]
MRCRKFFALTTMLLLLSAAGVLLANGSQTDRKVVNIMFVGGSYTYGLLADFTVTPSPFPLLALENLNEDRDLNDFCFQSYGIIGGVASSLNYSVIEKEFKQDHQALKGYQKHSYFHGLTAIPGLCFSNLNFLLDNHSFEDLKPWNFERKFNSCNTLFRTHKWTLLLKEKPVYSTRFDAEKLLSAPPIDIVILWLGENDMTYKNTALHNFTPYRELIEKLYSALDNIPGRGYLMLINLPQTAAADSQTSLENFKYFNSELKKFYKDQKLSKPKLLLVDLNDTADPDVAEFNKQWISKYNTVFPADGTPYKNLGCIVAKKIKGIIKEHK